MAEWGIVLLITMTIVHVDYRITKYNMDVPYNGFGCIKGVLAGKLLAPMQHRVLVPWLMKVLGFSPQMYLYIKATSILFAMVTSYLYLSSLTELLVLGIFLCLATVYDYSDTYIELGLFAIVFIWLQESYPFGELVIPLCAFVGALNRETAIFIPLAVLFSGWWMIGAGALIAFAMGMSIPLLMFGYRRRYCGNNSIKLNIKEIRQTYASQVPWIFNLYNHFFVFMAVFVCLYAATPHWTGVEVAMGLLVLAPLIPATWREIRVYAPAMLALIPMGARLL